MTLLCLTAVSCSSADDSFYRRRQTEWSGFSFKCSAEEPDRDVLVLRRGTPALRFYIRNFNLERAQLAKALDLYYSLSTILSTTACSSLMNESEGSSFSEHMLTLLLGLIVGLLSGFLSEAVKQEYDEHRTRHVVRLEKQIEQAISCDPAWKVSETPLRLPTSCSKVTFSVAREGIGSIPKLEMTVSLKDTDVAFVSERADSQPGFFPAQVETVQSLGEEQFRSRTLEIKEFRYPQRLVLTLFLGGSKSIPAGTTLLRVASSDERIAVKTEPEYASLYMVSWVSIAVALILLSSGLLWMLKALRASKAQKGKLEQEIASLRSQFGGGE